LPPQIPGTFIGQKGRISYYIEAVLDIPWRFDKEVKSSFKVVRLDDLNQHPALMLPSEQSTKESYCCFCYCGGPCKMFASIPHQGFSPGSLIPIKIKYINQSILDVHATKFILKRISTFNGELNGIFQNSCRSKVVHEVVFDVAGRGAKKGNTFDFMFRVQIPEDTPHTNTRHCNVVHIQYYLKIKGLVGCCHSDLKLVFPITIGAVGIGEPTILQRQRQPSPIPPFVGMHIPNAPPSISTNINPPNITLRSFKPTAPLDVDEELPPTFEEAIGMKNLKDEEKEPVVPKYSEMNNLSAFK
jgi:hypothetical protein